MKQFILIFLATLMSFQTQAQVQQEEKRKFITPIWLSHSSNTDILGLSLGFYPKAWVKDFKNTRTFGLRTEIFVFSPLYFLAPRSPLSRTDEQYDLLINNKEVSEQIYGINISTGTFDIIDSYGISITGIIHYSRKNNGISIAGLGNVIERANGLIIGTAGNEVYKGNGLMIAGMGNEVKHFNGIQIGGTNDIIAYGRGIQIGIYNKAKNFKGLQIGLWNENDKRSFPIINW
ncbi:hypothetical protein GWK08_04155 [Leptobacterium flavescens]|uniref:Uncharacterized protein n=1 Tax=Leptobacterium flavescens TaxID=472055 RepID=A0A6P0UH37_9FLAO|nr:hypothetical protein [Leptobacterium flavescens]NER12621.1 hypothetical protein [Leptobacterium flavescens]